MARPGRGDVDYYRVLEVSPEASADEIRRAYRRLALRWHPDRNPGDPRAEERFREVSEAYAVLVDPARRREYEAARRAGAAWAPRGGREDLFRDLFADPVASAVFEEVAREIGRLGLKVDRHDFQRVLFGGRVVVTGGVFVLTPLTPVLALFRVARAAFGAARSRAKVSGGGAAALPPPRGLAAALTGLGRWLRGRPEADPSTTVTPAEAPDRSITRPLRLTAAEARAGTRRRVRLEDAAGGEVVVTVPAGTRAGTRLRLRGKGPGAPGLPPGDLYLTVEIDG